MKMKIYSYLFCFFVSTVLVKSYPDQGKWIFQSYPGSNLFGVSKCLFKGSRIFIHIDCEKSYTGYITIGWVLRKTPCWKEFLVGKYNNELLLYLYQYPNGSVLHSDYKAASMKVVEKQYKCEEHIIIEPVQTDELLEADHEEATKVVEAVVTEKNTKNSSSSLAVHPSNVNSKGQPHTEHPQAFAPADGIYIVIIYVSTEKNESYFADLKIEMWGDYGYLSAADWPLLAFYGAMCLVYIIYGLVWLIVSFMQWRDLLRVQYWIGAVIFLGMLEMALFTAEYQSINANGNSIPGLIIVAELVSCAKRTLARMLIIIVCLGFGIVKPRLGIVLHRVVGIGLLYFVLASIEGCTRALKPRDDPDKQAFLTVIPLALLESVIVWWIFSGLSQTMRTLRLRRNHVKYTLYYHFTITLAFGIIASVIFMIWDISDWKELWVDDAVWHLLFAFLLLVIMILWRPTINNQRFAFSPILDNGSDAEDEENEKLMADVSDSMKLRSSRLSNSSPESRHCTEDDLKWIEENIPSTLADSALPVLDSDEEILASKFEISKMQ